MATPTRTCPRFARASAATSRFRRPSSKRSASQRYWRRRAAIPNSHRTIMTRKTRRGGTDEVLEYQKKKASMRTAVNPGDRPFFFGKFGAVALTANQVWQVMEGGLLLRKWLDGFLEDGLLGFLVERTSKSYPWFSGILELDPSWWECQAVARPFISPVASRPDRSINYNAR